MRYELIMKTAAFLFFGSVAWAQAPIPPATPPQNLPAGGVSKTWTGAGGDNSWNNANNWNPAGTPGPKDQAVIGPPDRGVIMVTAGVLHVYELRIANSADGNPNNNTTLTGNPDLRVIIGSPPPVGGGNSYIGVGCHVKGIDGANGVAGGNIAAPGGTCTVTIHGHLTNNGRIHGGKGGDGPSGMDTRQGGDSTVTTGGTGTFVNGGVCAGGAGGNKTGTAGPCGPNGGVGGDSTVTAGTPNPANKLGKNEGGAPGGFTPNPPGTGLQPGTGAPGPRGDAHDEGFGKKKQGDSSKGKKNGCKYSGTLDLTEAEQLAFVGEPGPIRISASVIDLTGIPAGTQIFQANEICFSGTVLTSPGVSIQSLCGTALLHFGGSFAATDSVEILASENFDSGSAKIPPDGWSAQVLMGSTGFRFDNPSNVALHPNMGCKAAVVNANMNAGGPLVAALDTPNNSAFGLTGPILIEWEQFHQACACGNSNAQVVVVADGVPMLVYSTNTSTGPFDFRQIDISSQVAGANAFFVRFQYQAANAGAWAIDNVAIRLPVPSLPGQAPQLGLAVLDINNARNANNQPVFLGQPGPYFSDIPTNSLLSLHIAGAPNQTIFLATGFVMPSALNFAPFGQLDLDGVAIVGTFFTDPFGSFDLPVFIPPALSGLTLGLQAALTHPTSGLALSNAVEVQFGP